MDVIDTRRKLHEIPEIGWKEVQTTIWLIQRLRERGLLVHCGKNIHTRRLGVPAEIERETKDRAPLETPFAAQEIASALLTLQEIQEIRKGYTGLIAVLETGRPGPVVGLRTDIDALGQQETTDPNHAPNQQGFQSKNPGAMHACGHDGHMAIALSVIDRLVAQKEHFSGRFVFFFQPAEEGVRGGYSMSALPVVDTLDFFLGFHLGMGLPSGTIGVGTRDFLGTRKVQVHFTGRSSHAGKAPEAGRSAILGAATFALACHSLPQYPGTSRVNVGLIQGGSALNVVPAKAEVGLELRADTNAVLADLMARVEDMASGAARTYQLESTLSVIGAADLLEPADEEALERKIAERLETQGFQVEWHPSFHASEDVTFFMNRVHAQGKHALHLMIGADLAADHHRPDFDFDEKVLASSAAVVEDILTGF